MGNRIDLTGQRFGRLVAVERVGGHIPGQGCQWRCVCDCGNETITTVQMLRASLRRSCGCLQRESRLVDITGRRYGKLTVVRPTGRIIKGSAEWECTCDCGNTCLAARQSLQSGFKTSCGCLRYAQQIVAASKARAANFKDGTNLGRIRSTKPLANNTSGVTGVSWHKKNRRWVARITFKGKTYALGYSDTLEGAAQLRRAGEREFFGKYRDDPPDEK